MSLFLLNRLSHLIIRQLMDGYRVKEMYFRRKGTGLGVLVKILWSRSFVAVGSPDHGPRQKFLDLRENVVVN